MAGGSLSDHGEPLVTADAPLALEIGPEAPLDWGAKQRFNTPCSLADPLSGRRNDGETQPKRAHGTHESYLTTEAVAGTVLVADAWLPGSASPHLWR
jgi:hypothetical protein